MDQLDQLDQNNLIGSSVLDQLKKINSIGMIRSTRFHLFEDQVIIVYLLPEVHQVENTSSKIRYIIKQDLLNLSELEPTTITG